MKSLLTSIAATLISGALAAVPALASAQETSDSPQRLGESLTAAFERLTSDGAALYDIEIALAPAVDQRGVGRRYVVAYRDLGPNVIAPGCGNCSRVVAADLVRPKIVRFGLTSAWYHRGPLMLEVTDERNGTLVARIGPLQLPASASSVRPYGRAGLGANDLYLHGQGDLAAGEDIVLQVFGHHSDAKKILGFALDEARQAVSGGELLLDLRRAVIVPFDGSMARFQLQEWMVGLRVHAQVATIEDDAAGRQIVRWSNGLRIRTTARR